MKEDFGNFPKSALAAEQTHDDNHELIEKTYISWHLSSSMHTICGTWCRHQTRWMSTIIYTFKIWMFRSQFSLIVTEEKGLGELCIFFANAWYTTPLPTAAPNNDLKLLKSLLVYSLVNAAIFKTGWGKSWRSLTIQSVVRPTTKWWEKWIRLTWKSIHVSNAKHVTLHVVDGERKPFKPSSEHCLAQLRQHQQPIATKMKPW